MVNADRVKPIPENILSVTLADVRTAYNGQDRVCRCGCAGNYTTPVENARVAGHRLAAVQAAVRRHETVDAAFGGAPDEVYFNYSYGKDRATTIYAMLPSPAVDSKEARLVLARAEVDKAWTYAERVRLDSDRVVDEVNRTRSDADLAWREAKRKVADIEAET